MSHGGDDTQACCILGVCCRRGGSKQAQTLDRMIAGRPPAEVILGMYQLVPLALLEERKEFAALLDTELRGYLERRGVTIKAEAEAGAEAEPTAET